MRLLPHLLACLRRSAPWIWPLLGGWLAVELLLSAVAASVPGLHRLLAAGLATVPALLAAWLLALAAAGLPGAPPPRRIAAVGAALGPWLRSVLTPGELGLATGAALAALLPAALLLLLGVAWLGLDPFRCWADLPSPPIQLCMAEAPATAVFLLGAWLLGNLSLLAVAVATPLLALLRALDRLSVRGGWRLLWRLLLRVDLVLPGLLLLLGALGAVALLPALASPEGLLALFAVRAPSVLLGAVLAWVGLAVVAAAAARGLLPVRP